MYHSKILYLIVEIIVFQKLLNKDNVKLSKKFLICKYLKKLMGNRKNCIQADVHLLKDMNESFFNVLSRSGS